MAELMNAIIGALDAHTTMSSQALDSEAVRSGLKDVLLRPARLYESLRGRVALTRRRSVEAGHRQRGACQREALEALEIRAISRLKLRPM